MVKRIRALRAYRQRQGVTPRPRDLQTEIMGPQASGMRRIEGAHPAQGINPVKLASILRDAENSDATRYLELAEEMEEKDLHYAAVLGVRKRGIRAMTLIVEPASDESRDQDAAAFVEDQLGKTATGMALQDMLDGLGKGYAATEIVWDRDGARWEIGDLIWRPQRWFEFDRVDGCTLHLRDTGGPVAIPPAKLIAHMPKVKSGIPIRGGLARLAAWGYMFKNFSIRDWAIFIEAYGHPLRLGKFDTSATEAQKRTLLRAVQRIGTDMAAIIPGSMEMEFVAAKTGNVEFYERKARYWDEQISKGVLGQVATTDAIAGGHAVGKVHEQVRDDIRDADGEQLAATLERDLVRWLTVFNFGPEAGVPRLRFEAPDEIPIEDFRKGVETLVGLGVPVARSAVYERYGLSPPQEGEEVIGGAAPEPEPEPEPDPPVEEEDAAQITASLKTLLAARQEQTSLDDLVDALLDAPVPDPGFADIEAALAGARSLEDVRAVLAQLAASEGDPAGFVDLLARATAMARAAGALGADIGEGGA